MLFSIHETERGTMVFIPDQTLRRYIAYSYEEETWVHDPKMPVELNEEFEEFKRRIMESKDKLDEEEQNI